MAITKDLIIKGVFGLAAMGSGGVCAVCYKDDIDEFFFKLKGKKEAHGRDAIGLPKDCVMGNEDSRECELAEKDLGFVGFPIKVKGKLKVGGLEKGGKVDLKIEKIEDDSIRYPNGRKYTFTNKNEGDVTILNEKTTSSIVLKKDVDVSFGSDGVKLLFIPTEDDLGIPLDCESSKVGVNGVLRECELDEGQLKKVKFNPIYNRNNHPNIEVVGLGGKKIKLRIEYTEDSKFTRNRKYVFDNTDGDVNVEVKRGNLKVNLEKQKLIHFKLQDNRYLMEDISEANTVDTARQHNATKINGLLSKVGVEGVSVSKASYYFESNKSNLKKRTVKLGLEDIKKIKFKDLGGSADDVDGLDDNKQITFEFVYENDSKKYPENIKFTFINNSDGEVKLTKDGKSLVFSKGGSGALNFKFSGDQLEKVN